MWIFVKSGIASGHGGDSERKRIDNLQPTNKVEDVKVLISEALGMKRLNMKVFHKGTMLEDGRTLQEYGIKQDETLQVFPIPPGIAPKSPTPTRLLRDPDAMDISPARMTPVVSLVTPSPPSDTPIRGKTFAIPPLASDSDSDDDAPDVIAGTRALSPKQTPYSGPRTTEYDQDELRILQGLGDTICDECMKWPRRPCNTCGCFVCGGKDNENQTLVCDKCEDYYHIDCLDPPLTELPEEEWFCPKCSGDKGKGVEQDRVEQDRDGVKQEVAPIVPEKKPARQRKTGGKTTSTSSVTAKLKTCTLVDPHHFGPIPGVEVGQSWKFRKQCSESGVHRPPMAGISGTSRSGSQSIVISGGYKDDVDDGETFLYSGSGGREADGTARIATGQSFDQTLTKSNAALAVTMFPHGMDPEKLDVNGAVADDWQQSRPVRVVRSDKMKHSKFAPAEGFRYDGIYKLLRYWPEKGKDGFIIYRYEFRRDDPAPAPWTAEGKARIEQLGLQMIYPEDWDPVARKSKGNATNSGAGAGKRKREAMVVGGKRLKVTYKPPAKLAELIAADTRNAGNWKRILEQSADVNAFVEVFVAEFTCPVCEDFINEPVTTRCGHNVCRGCLEKSVESVGVKCPTCWEFLVDGDENERKEKWRAEGGGRMNEEMVNALRYFNPEYSGGIKGY